MTRKVVVAGVGMVPFRKPGQSDDYDVMGAAAAEAALKDAGVDYAHVRQAYAGYVYGDSTCGQTALYHIGMTGIPVVNVNNNCSTGSTALWLARQAVESGAVDCALALGFEQMFPGPLPKIYDDRPSPMDRFVAATEAVQGHSEDPMAPKMFGAAGQEYRDKYGAKPETFARITWKARRHAAKNPFAIFRDPVTVEEVMASKSMYGDLTRLQCCPPTCGAAAAVVCSEAFARRHGLDASVRIAGQEMVTDAPDTFGDRSPMKIVGAGMTKVAADRLYESTGIGPEDVSLVELHDCFTANEIITYDGLGLCKEGEAEKLVEDGDNTHGGKWVVNPSGGLLSKGHPLGATGLGQCAEIVWQLRGTSGERQVEGARLGLQHNLGLGGACVVTLYERTS